MSSRFETYAELEARLRRMDDSTLVQLLLGADATPGLGCSRIVAIGGTRVFTKSLPLTRQEHERAYSTENLFRLPAYYHYGVGSAGFGAFRELAAHTKTTRWVLGGEIETFPLLYHHRILPIGGESLDMQDDELDDYVTYWEGSGAVRAYMLARQSAEHQVVLFLEYVPQVLASWVPANLDQVAMVTSGMHRTILARPRRRPLRCAPRQHPDRRAPMLSHRLWPRHRRGVRARRRGARVPRRSPPLRRRRIRASPVSAGAPVDAWDDVTRREVCQRHGDTTPATILANLDALADAGALRLPAAYRETLLRYRDAIVMMDCVFAALRSGSKLHGGYNDEGLRQALAQAGWRFLAT